MMTVKKGMVTGLFLLTVIFCGCAGSERAPVQKSPSPQRQQAAPHRADGVQEPPEHALARIVPDFPTAATDLCVISSGRGELTYRWARNGKVIQGENGPVLSRNHFSKGDDISAAVTAGGKEGTVSVLIGNSLPEVVSVRFSPEHICRGVDITAVPEAIDRDGDQVTLNYRWSINDVELSVHEPVLRGDAFKRGDQVILTIELSDGEGEGIPFISRSFTIPNAPPRFLSVPPADFKGETYVYRAAAEDPDGDALTYSLTTASTGMTIDGRSGVVTWKINKEHTGKHTIEIVGQDPEGLKAFQKYSLAITMPHEVNDEK
jgi:hypothetical protein